MKLYLHVASDQPAPPLRLAASELLHWLQVGCPTQKTGQTQSLERADFVLGTFEDVAGVLGEGLSNDAWADEIIIRTVQNRLVLAGSNPRSVLFAVYSYLESLGFAWPLPGEEGAVIPPLGTLPPRNFDIRHRASLLYRGIAFGGACDVERGEEFVAWMARNHFNYLFMEGYTAKKLYEMGLDRNVSRAEATRYDRRILRAAKKRGLIFETMGHGWTAWTLGFPPDTQTLKKDTLSPENRALTAQVDGKRGLFGNAPGNTNLCLSQPEAQRRMTELVREFAKTAPDVDVLGVWMGDAFNNWCECEACAKVHPSDLWVQLINRIARDVYEVRADLKVEVLGYSSLMEPPPTERIDNSRGNLIFMYAPYQRCYLHTFDDPQCVHETPLPRFPPANRWHYPMNAEYSKFFKGWLDRFEGTNYVFDYYCWMPITRDIFEGNVAETVCRDLKSYPAHGITGCVDCSRAQSFWPTPLARWMQARAGWDASVNYEAERDHLLQLVFGPHAPAVDEYLATTYESLLPNPHGQEHERAFDAEQVRRFKAAFPDLRRALAEAVSSSTGTRAKYLQRVLIHADFTLLHLNYLLAEAAGQYDEAGVLVTEMHEVALRNASVLAGVADPREINWLEKSTLRRLQEKKEGRYVREDWIT